jgi:hypothetical protein
MDERITRLSTRGATGAGVMTVDVTAVDIAAVGVTA